MAVNLKELVETKMKNENLSLRNAGEQANVAHTTIQRVIKGKPIDLSTMEKICKWVGIPVSDMIEIKTDVEARQSDIASLMALHPELGEVLSTLAREITVGVMDPKILVEVTGFTSYRMQVYREKGYEDTKK